MTSRVARALLSAAGELVEALAPLRFAKPVAHVYQPLDYASAGYRAYVERWGASEREILWIGMNPGPFGMMQTGVPFGDVAKVRDFLGITAPVRAPSGAHPSRPVDGFACARSEVSGTRLWGTIQERFGAPERFFARFFVANYCPLAFLDEGARNLTPDKLPKHEREPLEAACDVHLRALFAAMKPRLVIGVGAFAEARARHALGGLDVAFGRITHPSPANPTANRDWAGLVTRELAALGVAFVG
ncbi:MAG: single-stranded DNA-binding protein [Deltaproteobacteria bacterium]|nr:single-stranded DNA-binding protein [Deltaproteobacteria bacterium]